VVFLVRAESPGRNDLSTQIARAAAPPCSDLRRQLLWNRLCLERARGEVEFPLRTE